MRVIAYALADATRSLRLLASPVRLLDLCCCLLFQSDYPHDSE